MAYIHAKRKQERLTEYVYDLIWLMAKSGYQDFASPMPSTVSDDTKIDMRSGKQIADDILRKLGKEG